MFINGRAVTTFFSSSPAPHSTFLGASTPTLYPRDHCVWSSRSESCDGWGDWPIGKRIGICIGAAIGFMIILKVFWRCFGRQQSAEKGSEPDPDLSSVWWGVDPRQRVARHRIDDYQQGVRGLRTKDSTEGYIARAQVGRSDVENVRSPPPTYHEAMTAQQRVIMHSETQSGNIPTSYYPHLVPLGYYPPPGTTMPAASITYYPPPSPPRQRQS